MSLLGLNNLSQTYVKLLISEPVYLFCMIYVKMFIYSQSTKIFIMTNLLRSIVLRMLVSLDFSCLVSPIIARNPFISGKDLC